MRAIISSAQSLLDEIELDIEESDRSMKGIILRERSVDIDKNLGT